MAPAESARYRLECPRCAGEMTALDGAAALECPHCRERYFLGADGNVGWLVPPRVHPTEAADAARRDAITTRSSISVNAATDRDEERGAFFVV